MTKDQLLHSLIEQHYVCLKPSGIHGVGVFALRNIPKDCTKMFSTEPGEWHRLDFSEVEHLPPHARKLIETYCLFDETHYFVPAQGFQVMDLSLFLNHSDQPNIVSVDEGAYFMSLREIIAGEELLIDYGTLVDSEE